MEVSTLQNGAYYKKDPRAARAYSNDPDYLDSYDHEPHSSPNLAPAAQGYDLQPQYKAALLTEAQRKRSLVREILRFISCGLVMVGISAAALSSQYGAPETVEKLKSIKKTFSANLGIPRSLSTSSHVKSSSSVPSIERNRSGPEEVTRPLTIATEEHVQHQLEAIATDVASVQSLLHQFAASQAMLAAQVSTIRAANESLNDKAWWLTQTATFVEPTSKDQHHTGRGSLPSASSVRH
jgi:hypothetical protein